MPLPQLNLVSATGIAYCEPVEGIEEGADRNGVYARKPYLCAYADRWKFLRELRGYSTVSGGKVLRHPPAVYPDNKLLYADDARVSPLITGVRQGVNQVTFDYAKIDVTFKTPDYNYESGGGTGEPAVDGVTYGTVRLAFAGEFVTIPGRKARFKTSGEALDSNPGVLVPNLEYSITRHQIPYLPVTIIKGLVGKINSAAWLGFDAETVLFVGGEADRSATSEGLQAWTIDFKFLWRPVSWNMGLTTNRTWEYVVFNGSNPPPPITGGNLTYDSGDFTLLP